MYLLGDLVAYGAHGVCRITDLIEKRVDKKVIPYFVLEPAEQPGTKFYIPSENAAALAKIRPLLDKQTVQTMLTERDYEDVWIPEDNRRKLRYREILNGMEAVEMIRMMRSLYHYRGEQLAAGRKFHQCDESFLHDAEKVLSGELSMVLEMPKTEVLAYIREVLSK